MDQVEALPIKAFEYGGIIRTHKNGAFLIDRRMAQQLEHNGLLRIVKPSADPSQAAGKPLSASPAAQASPSQTSNESSGGARRGRPKRGAE